MSLVLNVEILGEFKKLTAATQGANKQLTGLQGTASKISSGIGKAFAGIGVGLSFAFIARELKEATKAAVEDAKSQGLLANQLKNTTNATDQQISAVEKQINALSRTASIADDELRPAYATLLRTTKSTSKAMDLLTLASDVSAGSGKGLTSVTMALSKAYQGKMAALTKLGIPMSDSIQNASDYAKEMTKLNKLQMDAANTVGPDHAEALAKVAEQQDLVNRIAAAGINWQKDLADAFSGSAEKAAKLDPYQRFQVAIGEVSESVGNALLPALGYLADWFVEVQPDIQRFLDGLVTALKNKEVDAAIVRMQGALGNLGLTIGTLFGSTETDQAKGFQNFWIILAGSIELVATLLAGLGAPIAAAFGNTKPMEKYLDSLLGGAQQLLTGKNSFNTPKLATPPPLTLGNTGPAYPITININKGNVTAKEIANAVNKGAKSTGSPSITSAALRRLGAQ